MNMLNSTMLNQSQCNTSPRRSRNVSTFLCNGVVKEASTATKLRVVFDASAKTSTGHSFNDTLLPGPSQYPLLTSILVKFRQHTIGMLSDISKMFREVELHKEERDYHRYITRNKDTNEMEDWRMTFGVASSPFLAT